MKTGTTRLFGNLEVVDFRLGACLYSRLFPIEGKAFVTHLKDNLQ